MGMLYILNFSASVISGIIVALLSLHISCRNNLKKQLDLLKREIDYNLGLCKTNEDLVQGMINVHQDFPLHPFSSSVWETWRVHFQEIPSTDKAYTYVGLINAQIRTAPSGDTRSLNSISYNISELRKAIDESKNELDKIKLKRIRCEYDFTLNS